MPSRHFSCAAPLLAVSLAAAPPARAQDPAPARSSPERYLALRLPDSGVLTGELKVLDRQTGLLYAVDVPKDRIVAVDPVRGSAYVKILKEVSQPASAPDMLTWPTATPSGQARFDPVVLNLGIGSIDRQSGRLYLVKDDQRLVLDVPAGTLTSSPLPSYDEIEEADVPRSNERRVVAALRALNKAQAEFRGRDLDQNGAYDFGTLEQLIDAGLLPKLGAAGIASGKYSGYEITLEVSQKFPQYVWWAHMRPLEPLKSGRRHYALTQHGVVLYSDRGPVKLNEEGRPEPDTPRLGPDERR